MTENVLVYVLDDDPDLAGSLARTLRRLGNGSEPFVDAEGLVHAFSAAPAHCVLTDVLMGDTHGFDVADRIREIDPATAIIFMTALPSTSAAVDAVRHHGGIDYLEKPIDEARLQQSIREALSWSLSRRRVVDRLAKLTPRERDVFRLLVRGMSNKAIAGHLQISARTVEDHRSRIADKTGAHNLEQMIALTVTDQMIGLVSGQSNTSGIFPDMPPSRKS